MNGKKDVNHLNLKAKMLKLIQLSQEHMNNKYVNIEIVIFQLIYKLI